MPDYDGVNLIITLDSGVTEVDIINDVYVPWKDWMLVSPVNRKFPAAFRSDGGATLTTVLNQGSYIFLANDAGWRLRPPEEDITIYFTGNLAVEDVSLPAFIPTLGNFTTAIVGIQPITQGVTSDMAIQLLEMWKTLGLDIANPMTVTPILRTAGDISQTITGDGETTTTVTRDP